MKRLQLRHHDVTLPNREEALNFFNDIVDSTKIASTKFGESLYAEPMVVKYLDSNNNTQVILAIGVDSPNVKYHIIDSQEIYELIKQNEQSIKDERERAIAQEIFLEEKIDSEYVRATSAETVLHERIDDEINRALSAETILQANIDAETNRALSAETALQTNIDNNKTKIVQVTQSGENILEEYALKNALGETLGNTIKVYKDSSLVGALTGFKGAKYVEKNEDGTFSLLYDENTRDESVEYLYLVYKNENGELRLVAIDFENFLMEAEFGDGLKVINHVASIKIKDGEKYLTTSKDGISTIGIDDAINESVNELKENVDEKLKNLSDTFDEKLDTISDTLSGNIISLTEEFINVSNTLSGNIISLDTKIDAEVKTLDEKIDNVNETLSANIITVDTKIDTQVDILNERIDTEVDILDKRIVDQVDILNTRIDTEVKTLNEKIDTSIDTLETNLNEVINTKETELRKEITSNKIFSKDVVLIENETGTTLEIQADEITITKKADANTIYDTNVAVFGSLLKVKQVEPTNSSIKTRYELQGADGKLIGDAIELPVESALISVKQGKEGDEIDKTTGNYIKFGEGDTTMNFIYRLADGSFELAQIIISEYFTDAHFGYGLNNQDGVVSLKEGDGNEYLVIGIDTISVIGVNDAIRNATKEVEEKLTEYIDTEISIVNERIDKEVEELKKEITDEATEREEADKELQGKIDAEYERATSAETALDKRIVEEVNLREEGDKQLSERIDEEVSKFEEANNKLSEKIDAETERAISAETALDKRIVEELKTINETISEKVDTAISNSLENINDEIEEKINDAISNVLGENIDERVNELQGKIDAETERATSAENALQTSINNLSNEVETIAREAAAEEVAKIVADSEESLETLKEIAEWISNDTTGAAQMANDIASLKTSNTENVTNINTLSGSVSTISGNINALSGSVSTISKNVNTLSGDVKTLSSSVSTISGNVDTLSGDVKTLSGSVITLSSNIDSLSGSVSSDISSLYGAIKTLEGKITGSTDVSGSTNIDETIINELKAQISGLTDEIAELNTKISGLTDEIKSIKDSQKETVREIIKSYLVGTGNEIKIYEIPEGEKIYDEDKLAIGFADDAIFG